jgi:hypothetical protein
VHDLPDERQRLLRLIADDHDRDVGALGRGDRPDPVEIPLAGGGLPQRCDCLRDLPESRRPSIGDEDAKRFWRCVH